MITIELLAETNKVRDDVGCDHDGVFDQRRHRGLFEVLDDFRSANNRLAKTRILHVEAFEFCFLLRKQIKRCLIDVCRGCFSSWFIIAVGCFDRMLGCLLGRFGRRWFGRLGWCFRRFLCNRRCFCCGLKEWIGLIGLFSRRWRFSRGLGFIFLRGVFLYRLHRLGWGASRGAAWRA